MKMYDIIHKKRLGGTLNKDEIDYFIKNYTEGKIPDYQASALCMAICINGMNMDETVLLTDAMVRSGDTVDLSEFGDRTVDKHSTGGVGDKTTLIIAPIVASLGCVMAKMSGRGLGHTGGTVDKLESISGYRTSLTSAEFLSAVRKNGICVIGQSADLAPADKKLYALRDVTATVDSIPLIASSIMSKKLAAGSHSIVLDVKVGSGAFMKTVEDAEKLARTMVEVGKECGRNMRAVITDMDIPLGNFIGNALEVKEAVDVLKNGKRNDLYEVCVELAVEMVSLCLSVSEKDARMLVIDSIESGKAFAKMKEWISSQGGDASMLDDTSLLPSASCKKILKSDKSGYISHMDTEKIGNSASLLGAGRISKGDTIDLSAGIELIKKTGDYVEAGDEIAVLHTSDAVRFAASEEVFKSALTYSEQKPKQLPLIFKKIK